MTDTALAESPVVETPVASPAETPVIETPAAPATPAATESAETPATPDAPAAKVPETYTLTLPVDTHFTASDLPIFEAQAKAMGLNQDQAQAYLDGHAATVAAVSAQYEAEARADPVIGGAKFVETVALAQKGRDRLFPPNDPESAEVLALFNKTGLGNHKTLLRAFARIGRSVTEDGHVQGQPPSIPDPRKRSAMERLAGDPPTS